MDVIRWPPHISGGHISHKMCSNTFYAVVPHVGICAGGGQQWLSLPRPTSDACQTTSGIRLETMEYELALRPTGSVQRLSSAAPQARTQSRSSTLGPITLGRKQTGAPSAGNPHAGCDEAGTGNRLTDRLVRHSQRKRRATDRSVLRGTAPVLDPTESLFEHYPASYYWTAYQTEWATDIVFREADFLKRLMPLLVRHGMLSFSSAD